jgi:hypothetical protein
MGAVHKIKLIDHGFSIQKHGRSEPILASLMVLANGSDSYQGFQKAVDGCRTEA